MVSIYRRRLKQRHEDDMAMPNETERPNIRVSLTNAAAQANAALVLVASRDMRRELVRSRCEALLTLLSQAIRDTRKMLADDSRRAAHRQSRRGLPAPQSRDQ